MGIRDSLSIKKAIKENYDKTIETNELIKMYK
jgi:hypothetical protein